MWEFHKACRKIHLGKSQGVVGRSFSSCGSWFWRDVTEFEEDDYPLVPFARMSGLTSCLAIYLKSLELDFEYVIEFFLPARSVDEADLQRLMKIVKQQIKNTSWGWRICINPGKKRRKRKRSESLIRFEEIKKHFGKTTDEAVAILHISRSTLKRICRNLGIARWLYRSGPDKTDSLMKSDQTDITHDLISLTINVSIQFLDGLGKLKDLIAEKFQLMNGSLSLKYVDEDADLISITTLQHLPLSLATFSRLSGRHVAGDTYLGRHVARDKLKGKAR
ncbi:NIN-like protein [Tanacetum coccineum]